MQGGFNNISDLKRQPTVPYKSAAQRGKFHVLERLGKISPSVVREFDQASKGMKLPQKVKPRHRAKFPSPKKP